MTCDKHTLNSTGKSHYFCFWTFIPRNQKHWLSAVRPVSKELSTISEPVPRPTLCRGHSADLPMDSQNLASCGMCENRRCCQVARLASCSEAVAKLWSVEWVLWEVLCNDEAPSTSKPTNVSCHGHMVCPGWISSFWHLWPPWTFK